MHNYISSAQDRASVMDYPPPMVTLNKMKWPSTAYTNEIGDWDKVSIQYGYEQFPKKQMKLQLLINCWPMPQNAHLLYIEPNPHHQMHILEPL
jgi:hypothetical protein